jgi:protocatechuate 3,4-dioxygenase beta subunit
MHPQDEHDDFGGLAADLPRLVNRRRALLVLGGGGLAAVLAACSSGAGTSAGTSSSPSSPSSPSSSTTEIPDETAGPYPGDGSNGPNVLTESGVVRQDIRPSFGQYSGTAEGVPMTLKLRVLDLKNGAAPLSGAAVYVWHCDRDGEYSLYTVTNQNYLRGVQVADTNGDVTFTSIFPGCYSGRWPHIHLEVYPSVDHATAAGTKLKTSQLALPEDSCQTVYATTGYGSSATNLSRTSLEQDMVFSDGWSSELATVTGDPTNGFAAKLTMAV